MPKLSCLAGGVAAMLTVSAAAAPLDRYTGSFNAEGVVADGPDATPREVRCTSMCCNGSRTGSRWTVPAGPI